VTLFHGTPRSQTLVQGQRTLSHPRIDGNELNVASQWLIDVNKELPAAHLEGFDISDEQYPCKAWLPDRISLQRLDVTKAIPQNLEARYDLVQVRLFLCVIQNEGPDAILKAIFNMLSQTLLLIHRVWLI